MKSILSILLTFTLFLSTSALVTAQIEFPAFYFTDLEGKAFTQEQLSTEKSTMIMFFDPYCDHCEQQATWIAEAEDQFKDVQFVFVTIEPEKEPVIKFRDKYFGKTQLKHVYFLQDLAFKFESYFGYTSDSVNIYLYKAGKKQSKYFGHEQKAEILLKFL